MNTGVIISAGEACLIDPGLFSDEMDDMARFIEEQGARPSVIVLTHSHWDHIVGPERFPGVKVIAQAEYLDFTRENSVELVKPLAKWAEHFGVKRDRPFMIPQPDEIFDDETTIQVGKLTMRLHHIPGHAVDQLAVRHEETAAVWASDILSDLEIPFISDNLAAYERTLEMVGTWEIKALVPGHGAATTDRTEIQERITQDKRYLAEVRARVEQALREGRTMDETVEMCADIEVRNPEINAESHVLNIESVYMELGGEGDPTKKGWTKDFFADEE